MTNRWRPGTRSIGGLLALAGALLPGLANLPGTAVGAPSEASGGPPAEAASTSRPPDVRMRDVTLRRWSPEGLELVVHAARAEGQRAVGTGQAVQVAGERLPGGGQSESTWFEADAAHGARAGRSVEGQGHVRVTRERAELHADQARYDGAAERLTAGPTTELLGPGLRLTGGQLVADTAGESAELGSATASRFVGVLPEHQP